MTNNSHWLEPDWTTPANVHAATTLRTGGVSVGSYASLNPAQHVGDAPDLVKQNRQMINSMLKLPSEPVWLNQIHSNRVVEAKTNATPESADASFTRQTGVVCAVMTADCLPLLVTTPDGSQIAAIHAGWRGLLDGIITNALATFSQSDLLIWLGPAIGPAAFEVGDEVRAAFVNQSSDYDSAFSPTANGKFLANIYQLARINLNKLGVKRIFGGSYCTFTDSDRFYSYRRDKNTGRMVSLIWRD